MNRHNRLTAAWLLAGCLSASVAIGQESAVQQYSDAGQKALAIGDYPAAERAYEKLRDLQPGIAEVHANLGLIYFEERKFDQAIQELEHALKLKPSLTKTEVLLAMSLSEVNRYQEALPGLEKGFRGSFDPEMKRLCGLQLERAYTGLRRDSDAVKVGLELNRLYPKDPEVLYHTGKIFGNFAFLTMQKLAQVAPASVWRHQTEAEAYESQGSNDAAISEYRQVLSVDPRRPGIHYRLGRTLLARSRQNNAPEDVTAAANEFTQELEVDPGNVNAAYELGEIHRNAGEFGEAQKLFEMAVESHPSFEEAQLGLGSVLMSLQKPDLALPHLQKAATLDAGNEVAWYRLSQVQGMLGHETEQKKTFAEFQRLRNRKSTQQEAGKQIFSPDEVTRQQLDSKAPHQ
jgi:tetratricopeptide (TPR) repeat protein